jgi:hypothetical protein
MTRVYLRSRNRARALVCVRGTVQAGAVSLTAFLIACSGGDLVLPQPTAGLRLAMVSGNKQTGTVGEALPKPLIVELRDVQGNPIVGRRVAFVATDGPSAAVFAPDTAVTDGDGQAVGQWVLGTTPGDYGAEARVVAAPDDPLNADLITPFSAAARPGRPDTLRAESKLAQGAQTGSPVQFPPTVRVVDRFGNPVPGIAVHWKASGGSTVSASTVVTGADGLATVTWTTGDRFGNYELEASVDGSVTGSPVIFSAFAYF